MKDYGSIKTPSQIDTVLDEREQACSKAQMSSLEEPFTTYGQYLKNTEKLLTAWGDVLLQLLSIPRINPWRYNGKSNKK